ncbi:MAG: polyprenyl synthetase family protein [Planctomycetes bacterium]|nr:polyprenyl synthetase family protein [Planctomycetota bacterium]
MGSATASAEIIRPQSAPVSLLELLSPIAGDLARVEDLLAQQVTEFDGGIGGYVEYVLGGTGKRLRPSLALLAGGATGRIHDDHVRLGVIVELIHIATLVHDDVLDEAALRHGLVTANSRWGNDISVLLGDCLFAHALKLAASYPTTVVCQRVSEATNTVCSGEILQTQKRFDLNLNLDQYLGLIKMKTGALFAVSCELGGGLNAAAPGEVKSLAEYGENLGVAYQIFDDCVDILGQERKAGKSLGTDVKQGKLTLPYLLLLHQSPAQREALGQMMFRDTPGDRRDLLALVTGNGVSHQAQVTIDTFIADARANLAALPANRFTQTLADLLDYLAQQSRALLTAAEGA